MLQIPMMTSFFRFGRPQRYKKENSVQLASDHDVEIILQSVVFLLLLKEDINRQADLMYATLF
jgi:hypothetical protein